MKADPQMPNKQNVDEDLWFDFYLLLSCFGKESISKDGNENQLSCAYSHL